MINSNLADPMLIVGAAPAPARPPQAPARGDNAFETALAGANAVRDRDRDGSNATRDANASHQSDRTQSTTTDRNDDDSTNRTQAASTDRSASKDDDAQKVSANDAAGKPKATKAADDDTDASKAGKPDDAKATDAAANAGAAAPTDATPDAAAQAAAAAQVAVDATAPVVASDVQAAAPASAVPAVTNDAVDAALKLAITATTGTKVADTTAAKGDPKATAATAPAADVAQADAVLLPTTTAAANAAAPVDDAKLVATAQTSTPAQDTGVVASADAQVGPTRPIASLNAQTTAGPAPEIDPAAATALQGATDAKAGGDAKPVAAAAAQPVQAQATAAPTAATPVAQPQVADDTAGTAPVVTAAVAATTQPGANADATAPAVDPTATDTSVDAVATATLQGAAGKHASADADASGDQGAGKGTPAPADITLAPAQQNAAAGAPTITAQIESAVQASQARVAQKQAIAEGAADTSAPAIKPLDSSSNLLQNLQPNVRADASIATAATQEAALPDSLQERIDTIAEQLATRLRLSQAAGGTQVQLALKPRELGDVTVQMKVREGVVAATVLVDRPDSLNTIQHHMDELRRSLEDQGLTIQQLSVDVRGDWAGSAAGANAQMFADARSGGHSGRGNSSNEQTSLAGAAGAIPGLTSKHEVDADEAHEGDVSVLI